MTQGQWACVRKWGKLLPTIFLQYRSAISFSGLTLKHPFITRQLNRTVLINGSNSGRRLTCITCILFPKTLVKQLLGRIWIYFSQTFWNVSWLVLKMKWSLSKKNWTFFIFVHAYNRKRRNVFRVCFCTKSTTHSTTNQIILKRHWFLIKSPELSNTTL